MPEIQNSQQGREKREEWMNEMERGEVGRDIRGE